LWVTDHTAEQSTKRTRVVRSDPIKRRISPETKKARSRSIRGQKKVLGLIRHCVLPRDECGCAKGK